VGLAAALAPLPSTSKTSFTFRRIAYLLTIYSNAAAYSLTSIQSLCFFQKRATCISQKVILSNLKLQFISKTTILSSYLSSDVSQPSLLQNTFQHFPKLSQVWGTNERSVRSANEMKVACALLHKVLPLLNIIFKPFLRTPSFHNT
jgi:hypothetical protein